MFFIRLLFIFCSGALWGAAPLFHAYVADKWVEILEDYDDEEKQAFIRGSLFPDIRYLAKIDRKITHQHGLTLKEIKNTNDPFLKGLRLHTFVDDVRAERLELPELLSEADLLIPGKSYHLLKLIEDEILYSMIPNEKSLYYSDLMKGIDPGALKFPIFSETIQTWNEVHARYFKTAPSLFLQEMAESGKSFFGLFDTALQDFIQAMIESKRRKTLRIHVAKSIDLFEDIFTKFAQAEN